jgi:hypothetical protein
VGVDAGGDEVWTFTPAAFADFRRQRIRRCRNAGDRDRINRVGLALAGHRWVGQRPVTFRGLARLDHGA